MENNLNGLTMSGFQSKNQPFDESLFKKNPTVALLRSMIQAYFTTSVQKPYLDSTSYGLKHIAEKHLDCYVANGEFIYAMHLEGFCITRLEDGNQNCYFNISKRDVKALKELYY